MSSSPSPQSGRPWKPLVITLLILAVIFVPLLLIANRKATRWLNGDGFRIMLDAETSKGLKFVAHYSNLQRVGLFGIHADSFQGTDGLKTIVSMDAKNISGSFAPSGIIFRQWQVDNVHIESGTVMLQKTESTPGASKKAPGMPWWGLFWPYRVELEDVKVDKANVLFQVQDKEAGIYQTFLEITPNGHDFEYDARGGQFKTPLSPPLEVQHVHLLIRRPRLYCPEFLLGDDPAHPEEQIRATGEAGLQDDRSIKLAVDLRSVDIGHFLPPKLQGHILGHANGHLDYNSTGTGLETAQAGGSISVVDGVLHDLSQVREYITVTHSPDPGDLSLSVCAMDLRWDKGAISIENIKIESKGVFRLTGNVTIAADKTLSGQLELGLTDAYLKWLPTARQTIFTRKDDDYNVTAIQVSGTLKKPQQDLTARVVHQIESSPTVALKLFFNQAEGWFNFE